mmetsp:Transcript_27106/g.59626  ORF Transcript_27106/g.59626 Transcript_27106/m.59626 type:complete len:107 (-) Transcript_27106:79-399(-)
MVVEIIFLSVNCVEKTGDSNQTTDNWLPVGLQGLYGATENRGIRAREKTAGLLHLGGADEIRQFRGLLAGSLEQGRRQKGRRSPLRRETGGSGGGKHVSKFALKSK